MKRFAKNMSIYLLLFVIVLGVAAFYRGNTDEQVVVKEVPVSQFIQYLEDEEIEKINVTDLKLTGQLDEKTVVYSYVNSVAEIQIIDQMYLFPQSLEGKLEYSSDAPDNGSLLLNLLPNLIMIGLVIFLMYFMMNQGGYG